MNELTFNLITSILIRCSKYQFALFNNPFLFAIFYLENCWWWSN